MQCSNYLNIKFSQKFLNGVRKEVVKCIERVGRGVRSEGVGVECEGVKGCGD